MVHMMESVPLRGIVLATEGHKIGITSHLNRLLRADLYAVEALPALLRLLIVGLHASLSSAMRS